MTSPRRESCESGVPRDAHPWLGWCGLQSPSMLSHRGLRWMMVGCENRPYGSAVTVQVLLYSKKPPKASWVFFACKAKVCVPGFNGAWVMPMP